MGPPTEGPVDVKVVRPRVVRTTPLSSSGRLPGNTPRGAPVRRELRLRRTLGVPALVQLRLRQRRLLDLLCAWRDRRVRARRHAARARPGRRLLHLDRLHLYGGHGGRARGRRRLQLRPPGLQRTGPFITGWGTLLSYTVTISISSFRRGQLSGRLLPRLRASGRRCASAPSWSSFC